MSDEPRPLGRWELMIEYLIELGWADDEIEDDFDQMARRQNGRFMMANLAGEFLDWGFLRGRRQILALLAEIRGTRDGLAPAEEVRAERARRIAAHEPHGYDALAKHFNCDASTIRRRLGVLAQK